MPTPAVPVPTSDISAVAQAITELEKLLDQRDAEMNTPAEQLAAENARVQAIFDRLTKAVTERNLAQFQQNIAASPNTGPDSTA